MAQYQYDVTLQQVGVDLNWNMLQEMLHILTYLTLNGMLIKFPV